MITIDLLKNHPQAIPRLARLSYDLISSLWIPEASVEGSIERFSGHLNSDILPLTLVALDGDRPVGMGSLRANDGISPSCVYAHLSTEASAKVGWLGSLVIDPEYQKRGIGKALIEAVKNKAKELGLSKLYLFTLNPIIYHYYVRLGWNILGTDTFRGHPAIVMEIQLQ